MDILTAYIFKSGCLLAVFYLFYKVLLSRETFFGLNRVTLLGIMVFSFVIPRLSFPAEWLPGDKQPYSSLDFLSGTGGYVNGFKSDVTSQATGISWQMVLLMVYAAGCVWFLWRFMYGMWRVALTVYKGRKERLKDGMILVIHNDKSLAPFSWLRYIVVSEQDLHSDYATAILAHEAAHVRKYHSLDMLLAEVCIVIQWFNPAVWLLKRELQNVHEYQADNAVLAAGVDARQYQMLLIKKAVGPRLYSLANSINHSSLKKRITMMIKKNQIHGHVSGTCLHCHWLLLQWQPSHNRNSVR